MRTTPQHFRHFSELIVRTKDHAQFMQARQIVRQRRERVTGEVEYLQRVRELVDFRRKSRQAARQIEAFSANQVAGAELCECVHDF
jgi:hypothetical protein